MEYQSAEDEVAELKALATQPLSVAQTKYEDISKLLTGLASGALLLSITIMDNLTKGGLSFWSKCILSVSWIALMISIVFGLYSLYRVYRFYREMGFTYKKIATNAEKSVNIGKAQKDKYHLTFEGKLIDEARATRLTETSKWPVVSQFITFAIGVSLLFVSGVLGLFR